jgi:hypothetical protein
MGVQSFGYAAEHAEGVAFVAGRLKPADLLLGSLQNLRQFLLRKPDLLPENSDLQCHTSQASPARSKREAKEGSFNCSSR